MRIGCLGVFTLDYLDYSLWRGESKQKKDILRATRDTLIIHATWPRRAEAHARIYFYWPIFQYYI